MSSPNHFACSWASEWQPDVHEQRAVVHGRPGLVIEPDQLGDPKGDQALAQDVLHRLAEAEIDAQRQRGHDLGEPNRRTRRASTPPGRRYGLVVASWPSVLPRRPRRRGSGSAVWLVRAVWAFVGWAGWRGVGVLRRPTGRPAGSVREVLAVPAKSASAVTVSPGFGMTSAFASSSFTSSGTPLTAGSATAGRMRSCSSNGAVRCYAGGSWAAMMRPMFAGLKNSGIGIVPAWTLTKSSMACW